VRAAQDVDATPLNGLNCTMPSYDSAAKDLAKFVPMNATHLSFLASDTWAEMLRADLLPWLTDSGDLGDEVLEIGPGPGRTTDLLRERASSVTALELDASLADALAARLTGTNVEVRQGDGTDTGLQADRFSSVTCFHMLHHMPTVEMQDLLFAEVCRVLRPGGALLVADALDQDSVRARHREEGETFVPLDPATVQDRLCRAGFADASIDLGDYQILLRARKPPLN
jgi:SAM-dependent methyltransferase